MSTSNETTEPREEDCDIDSIPARMWSADEDDLPSPSLSPEQEAAAEHSQETTSNAEQSRVQEEESIQGKALRSLVSKLTSEKDLTDVNRHQASTLSQLTKIKHGLAAINKESLDAYNDSAADFIKAARLASQVKQNLDDISRRLASLKKTLASRQAQQKSVQPSD